MNNEKLTNSLNVLKADCQPYLSTKEKEIIESLLQRIAAGDLENVENEYKDIQAKVDYRKTGVEKMNEQMTDKQKQFISDWSKGNYKID